MPPDVPPGDPGAPDAPHEPPNQLIETLVAQVLDDLQEERLEVEQALRQIATVAWQCAQGRSELPHARWP